MNPQQVLDFWFGAGELRGRPREVWFKKDPAFDRAVGERFLPWVECAAQGGLDPWLSRPDATLALILLLDQFPRNLFRGQARAFAADAAARRATRHALQRGFDAQLLPIERVFVYLPLEHSEHLADQDDCFRLMLELAKHAETASFHVWADKHRTIIRRFGRFPHRNAALGRESTAEEIEFLKTPGSGF
jgi:uncharacterized protein (DUF924 family)